VSTTTAAKRSTRKTAVKAESKTVAPKAVAPFIYNPGKPARPASSEGERRREAEDAVPPSLEGGSAALVNRFLEPRFLWFFEAEVEGQHVVWGATHDRTTGDPQTVSDAIQRATHTGRGRNLADAKRDLMLSIVVADRGLQTAFKKPVEPRKTATSKGAAPQVKPGDETKAQKPPTKAEAKRAEKAQATAEANPVTQEDVAAEVAATIASLKGEDTKVETPVVETPKPKPPSKQADEATKTEAPAAV